MGKKTPSPTFHSGKPATSETPAQIVSTIRGDTGLIRADDAQEAPATTLASPIDLLAYNCAFTAWSACHRWAVLNDLESVAWTDMLDGDHVIWAAQARWCMDDADHFPIFPAPWESAVRSKIFASVVRAIAL